MYISRAKCLAGLLWIGVGVLWQLHRGEPRRPHRWLGDKMITINMSVAEKLRDIYNLTMVLKIWNVSNMEIWNVENMKRRKGKYKAFGSGRRVRVVRPACIVRLVRRARPKPWELTKETENWRLNCPDFHFCISTFTSICICTCLLICICIQRKLDKSIVWHFSFYLSPHWFLYLFCQLRVFGRKQRLVAQLRCLDLPSF